MGLSCSWIAVEGAAKEAVLETLGMVATGDNPGDPSGPFSCADPHLGWTIFYVDRFEEHDVDRLSALSALGRTIGVAVEEHVMCSTAHGYQDGALQWSIVHDCDQGPRHLEATGALPDIFTPVRDRLVREQEDEGGDEAEVDLIFDIPVVVAQQICGFRVDELSDDQPVFTRVETPRRAPSHASSAKLETAAGGGFFSKLFGKR
jgi:hypothetical protein